MARRDIQVRVCDRCPTPRGPKATPATESLEVCFQGTTYKLDLCLPHKVRMETDIEAWTRLGREAESQHGAKKWIPGETFRNRDKPPVLQTGNEYTYVDGIRQSRPKPLVIPPARGPDVVIETPVELYEDELDRDLLLDIASSDLKPTISATHDLIAAGVTWEQVVEAVDNAFAITPGKRDNVSCYLTPSLSVLVGDNGSVIGVAKRDPADPLPQTSETHRHRILRKGKRGGQGRVSMTTKQIVEAINATPGWWVDDTRPHYAVHGPSGQRYTFPRTTSDTARGPQKTLHGLRSIGLDLIAPARHVS